MLNTICRPPRIAAALSVIDPVFLDSPQFVSDTLGAALGLRLLLKVETANPIRSFKGRGAECFVAGLDQRKPLVCASAGNFGQGLAWAAGRRGLQLSVFAARSANPLKIRRMRELGARVQLEGVDFDQAKQAAASFAEHTGAVFVEDGREAAIAEGAGTLGLELCRHPERIDAVFLPVGNGALINGVGCWVKANSPGTKVIGICAAGAACMAESWRSGKMVSLPASDTIADGIAVRVPVAEAVADMRALADDVRLVDDECLIEAMRLLFQHTGIAAEPAGAAGLAGILQAREEFAGRLVATPICGANLTQEQAKRWLL